MKRSLRAVIASGGVLIFANAICGQDALKKSPGKEKEVVAKPEKLTPDQRLEAMEKEYQTALRKLQEAYRDADSREERRRLESEEYPALQQESIRRFVQFANQQSGTPVAGQALMWVFRIGGSSADRKLAKQRWLEDHVDDGALAPYLGILAQDEEHEFLRALISKAKNKTVLGTGCFYLAMSLKGGEELTADNRPEVTKLLERVEKDFASVMLFAPTGPPAGKLGELVAPILYEIRHLAVGLVAPEIEGEDIDGVEFKLSDYRGNVVLLSYYGHW